MGLGRGPLSIMDQLVKKGVISYSFSLCYGGMDIGGGAMVLGELSLPYEMVFSRSDPLRSPYYNIELKEMHISDQPLRLKPKVFNSKHGTILDSGTTYAYLPEEAFVAFKDVIISTLHLKQIPGTDPNFKDICFFGAGRDATELSKIFPEFAMVFGNGQKLSLSPKNYLFQATVGAKMQGACKMIRVDLNKTMKVKPMFGMTDFINLKEIKNKTTMDAIKEMTDCMGVYYSFECTGARSITNQAFEDPILVLENVIENSISYLKR